MFLIDEESSFNGFGGIGIGGGGVGNIWNPNVIGVDVGNYWQPHGTVESPPQTFIPASFGGRVIGGHGTELVIPADGGVTYTTGVIPFDPAGIRPLPPVPATRDNTDNTGDNLRPIDTQTTGAVILPAPVTVPAAAAGSTGLLIAGAALLAWLLFSK